jgi:hypothetical protein
MGHNVRSVLKVFESPFNFEHIPGSLWHRYSVTVAQVLVAYQIKQYFTIAIWFTINMINSCNENYAFYCILKLNGLSKTFSTMSSTCEAGSNPLPEHTILHLFFICLRRVRIVHVVKLHVFTVLVSCCDGIYLLTLYTHDKFEDTKG